MEVSGQLHAPAVLSSENSFLYALDWRLVGPQSGSGHGDGKKKASFPPPQRLELQSSSP